MAPTALSAAAAGTTTPRTAGLRTGITTIPTTGTTTLGSVLCKLNNHGLDDQRVIDQDEFLFALLRLNHFENVILVAVANV